MFVKLLIIVKLHLLLYCRKFPKFLTHAKMKTVCPQSALRDVDALMCKTIYQTHA